MSLCDSWTMWIGKICVFLTGFLRTSDGKSGGKAVQETTIAWFQN